MPDLRSEIRNFIHYGTRISLVGGAINIVVGVLLLWMAQTGYEDVPPSHREGAVLFTLLGAFCLVIGIPLFLLGLGFRLGTWAKTRRRSGRLGDR